MLEKTYVPAEVEAKLYAEWESQGGFAAHPESNRTPYTIMMPPPNVTGSLHMGHALTFTLQDILVRYRRRLGRDTLWQPGTDHAGIATQMVVERQLAQQGIKRQDIGREEFERKVWEWKGKSGGTIVQQLRRLGASPDWERERFTLDEGLNAAVRKVFVQLHREKLIYRAKRLVNWDPKLHTAISDLEVVPTEVAGHLWHLRYPLADDPSQFIVVATTRPETMLGDTAVAVNPEDERYQHLIGKQVRLPLTGRLIPIVGDAYADPATGSGAVKITPAHDFNDFEVGKRHNLPLINIFTPDATLNDDVPEAYRGLDRFVARAKIVAELEELGALEKVEPHRHAIPYGDRSEVVIEPYLTDQWYCDAATLAAPAIAAVEEGRTEFVPKQWENTFFSWMRNIQPWCISRQLWWGHQIPAWYGPDGEVFVAETEQEAIEAAAKHYGRTETLRRDPDVLDTWFSSALWPFSTLGWPEATRELQRYYPGDVLVTGLDIIFFWVARMMMMGLHFMGDVPFRKVYIHALVRDEKGRKMSKSLGNVIDPLNLIDQYGCDSLRFTITALAAQGRDVKLAESRVAGYRNFTTKLWNAARFCQMNQCALDPAYRPEAAALTVNRWIYGEVVETAAKVATALEAFRFNDAAHVLYQFAWGTFCDWYLEFTKPIINGSDEAAKAETRAATAWALNQLLHLLNPVMPFVTEELTVQLGYGAAGAMVTAPWPDYPAPVDTTAAAEMNWVVRLITLVRNLKLDSNVPTKKDDQPVLPPLLLRDASPQTLARIEAHRPLILSLARVSSIEPTTETRIPGAVQAVLDEATVLMPIGEFIDFAAERARLTKEIAALEKEAEKLNRKLGDAAFVARAPEDVVEENRERLAEAGLAKEKLGRALERLELA